MDITAIGVLRFTPRHGNGGMPRYPQRRYLADVTPAGGIVVHHLRIPVTMRVISLTAFAVTLPAARHIAVTGDAESPRIN